VIGEFPGGGGNRSGRDRSGIPVPASRRPGRDYSGEMEVRPHSSQRKYTTGKASDRPMTFALGTPHRGQTIPDERLATVFLLYERIRLFRLPI